MIVVADAGPLNYLLLIGAANVLERLYERVVVPSAAAAEQGEPGAPPLVQTWIAKPPQWCEIRPDPASDVALNHPGPKERAAISLAVFLNADRLLIDEAR
jgi:predicted nucleic acid-binding protein